MILLSGHTLTKGRRIPLVSMSLSLKERDSTASIVPEDMTGIGINSWLLDDTKPGNGIVWRVRSIQQAFATDTPTVQLEHVINTLRDSVIFGEANAGNITGNKGADKCTAKQAVEYVMKWQSTWKLGDWTASNPKNAYKFSGDTLMDALETVMKTVGDAWWSFDMSSMPFRLNIIKKPSDVTCELRPGRNLETVTKTIDRSTMYTRLYPIGKDDLHIPGNYVQKNTGTYGVVGKVETDTSIDNADELKMWAEERLNNHCQPKVSVTATGQELADATGESLDRLTLGRLCRIPLEEFGTVIEERIVELRYKDKVNEPSVVTVTLANNQEDVARIIADAIKEGAGSSGKAARTGSRQAAKDHAWFEDTADHVAMCAEGIIGTDAQGNPNWKLLSQVVVDGTGIHQSVQEIQNENVIRDAKINVTSGKIEQTVSAIGKDGKITAGSICLAINNGNSEAVINANRIYLLGDTIAKKISADYIRSKIAALMEVQVKKLTSQRGGISVYSVGTTTFTMGGVKCDVPSGIHSLKIVKDGNTYTLQRKRFNDESFVDVGSFSRAITSWQFGWSGGVLTVTAQPQNQSTPAAVKRVLTHGEITLSGVQYTVPIKAAYGNDLQYEEDTGYKAYVDATQVYNNGKAAADCSVVVNDAGSFSSGSFPGPLSGWNPVQVGGVGNSENNKYRYIRFKVDGKNRSFYFA